MKKSILYIGLLLALMVQGASAESEYGGYAGAFLKMSIEARPAAMGGAYVGISDDAAGQLYNPAGLTAINRRNFTSSYRAMKLDRTLGFVSFILPTRRESTLGINWQFVGYGKVSVRNESGVDMGSSISSNEHIFGLAFAKQFSPFVGAGAKLNYYLKGGGTYNFEERIQYDLNATSIGINLGLMLSIDSLFEYGSMEGKKINDIKFGLVINNVAARYSWSAADVPGLIAAPEDEFPMTYIAGFSFRTFQRSLLAAVDVVKTVNQDIFARFGGEYTYKGNLALRAGLDDGALTAGMGYQFNIGQSSTLQFNYAFSGDRVGEGDDHLFGFHFKF